MSRPPDEGDWLAEVRLSGRRLRVRRCGAEVTLLDSDGADCTERFPSVARAVARLPVRGMILDGVLSDDVYVAFDLLHHDGFDFTLLPTTDRKEALRNLLASIPNGGVLRYGDHVRGRAADFFREACDLKVPGVVYKRADARYGEQGAWRWLSCVRDVTSPGKLLWPDAGIDKRELAQAYAALADRMLPGLLRRPLTLVRCPEGLDGDCFFQKHDRPGMSEALGRVPMGEKQPYLMVLDRAGLVSLAQVAALELHVQGVRADDLQRPDLLVLDLDPGEGVPWARVAATALALRELLEALGLVPLVRATGGKGLHVVAPLVPEATVEQVRDFTQGVALRFARRDPKHYTAKLGLQHRPGRILIDWVRNAHKATAIATWSPRAKPGAPVAAPLDWSDLDPGASGPPFIGLRQALERPDPWPDLNQAARPLPAFPGAP